VRREPASPPEQPPDPASAGPASAAAIEPAGAPPGQNPPTPAASAADWQRQAGALVLLAVVGTLPFWISDFDLSTAARFYHPDAGDPWWESGRTLWVLLYQAAPLLGGLLLMGSFLTIAAGWLWPVWRRRRRYAIFVLTVTLVGPGLVINGVSKEFWGRPRPHQIEDFGGTQAYVPPLIHNPGGDGMSFPSGHSAMGFALGTFYFVWRRRRPRLAWTALLGSLILGTLIGIGRMSAGDHFLSDVLWSAVFTYGIGFLLYWFILSIPAWEDRAAGRPPPPPARLAHPTLTAVIYVTATAALLFLVMLATPVQETRNLGLAALPPAAGPRILRLDADTATLTLFHLGNTGEAASIRLKGRGFGLPSSRVHGHLEHHGNTLTYTVTHTGIFTERDSTLTVGIDPTAWERVELRTGSGDIHLFPLGAQRPALLTETGKGQVRDENPAPAPAPTEPTL
jgi:lipid A 4'-phosphatase